MELIAHRAGNDLQVIAPAIEVADIVEVDVHLFRGHLEVRHEKVVWPLAIHWEKWEIVPNLTPHGLADVLRAAPAGAHLWLDLKGFTPRLTRRALEHVGERRPLTASTRSWWTLGAMRRLPDIRTFRSVGTRWQLWFALRLGVGSSGDGIVMHQRFADPETVTRLLRHTPDVVVWAVEDADRAVELAGMGVTGLIVDDLDLIGEIRTLLN